MIIGITFIVGIFCAFCFKCCCKKNKYGEYDFDDKMAENIVKSIGNDISKTVEYQTCGQVKIKRDEIKDYD